jgi:hypothetical protein
MKCVTWILAPLLSLACAGELRAQFPPYSYSGGGLGFSYQRRNFSLFGSLGFASGRMAVNAAFGLVPYPPPPYEYYGSPVLRTPGMRGFRPPPQPTLEDETAGIDLDLVPSKKPSSPEVVQAPRPAAPAVEMPGKDVSKQVPPVRPDDMPPPPMPPPEPPPLPPQPAPPPKPEPPPAPPVGPKEASAALTNLGLAAFSERAYGLAAHRFRQASAADPKGARAYFLLAQAQFALGKYAAAVESIHAGMRLHKDWPTAPFQPRLDLYGGIEPDFAAQLKHLEGAVRQAPERPELRFLLAYQLWFDNRRDEAVPLFRQARALTAEPRYIDAFLAAAAAPKQVVLK